MNWLVVLAALSAPAGAETAEEVVALMDGAMNRAVDQVIEWDVVNQEPGHGEPKTMAFEVYVRGSKNYTSFEAPADLKGTRVLILSRTQMYVFLPAYNKVRRIASHTTQQGFMGTSFSNDDMATSRYGDVYAPKLLSETDDQWVLEFIPIDGKEAPYPRVEITVDRKLGHPIVIKSFSEKGTHLKTETRTGYECQDDVCLAGVIRMDDHTRTGAWTELRRTAWKLNTGFSDDVFTTRTLQRGL